ncbi:hypothetical protein NLI96_g2050 [Meripilus lineatus]|uniref:Uncharacterized protein n=1 Tax=Meripilus lineatus TaxID=2056292 RepID=A0AAD5V9G4_9APHY|nr:hypothetical protein NLI96_g2050 [Physisporinus lineatus]
MEHPSGTASLSSSPVSSPPQTHATVITYRYNDQLAYVPVASHYDDAVQFAHKSFPDLADYDSASITFTLSVKVQGVKSSVMVGSLVWDQVSPSFVQYEILNVVVVPPRIPRLSVTKGSEDVPPPYFPEKSEDVAFLRSSPSHSRSRAASPTPSASSLLRKAAGWFERI